MLALPEMQAWERAALADDFRDEAHEAELRDAGEVNEGRRAALRLGCDLAEDRS